VSSTYFGRATRQLTADHGRRRELSAMSRSKRQSATSAVSSELPRRKRQNRNRADIMSWRELWKGADIPLAVVDKHLGVLQESFASRADEHAIWDTFAIPQA